MIMRTYVTIQGGYSALLKGRYCSPQVAGKYQKYYYVRLIGAEEPAEFPVAEHHIRRRLQVIQGGKR